MSYESVDQLQKALSENIFHYAKDSKKAAGRALGTLVEIITFYMLKAWGFGDYPYNATCLYLINNVDFGSNYEIKICIEKIFVDAIRDNLIK